MLDKPGETFGAAQIKMGEKADAQNQLVGGSERGKPLADCVMDTGVGFHEPGNHGRRQNLFIDFTSFNVGHP
jgi:hypothetical protein